MKAVAYQTPGSIDREDALQDITLEIPKAGGCDLLVKVFAVSVNPVDTKVRLRMAPEGGGWRVLGFDAAGVVEAVGSGVKGFQPGDAVFYAGSIDRPGTNAEYHRVDERIVGRKPVRLTHAEAAALPLTAITAWEMLFDRLDVHRPTPQGRFGLIDDPETLDGMPFKRKSVSIHWELMFTHPLYGTPDMEEQGRLLNEVAALVDAGRIRSTATEVAGRIDAATLRDVHARIESGTARGKIVLEGF